MAEPAASTYETPAGDVGIGTARSLVTTDTGDLAKIQRVKSACGNIDLRQIKGLMIGGTVGGSVSTIAGGLNFAGQIKNKVELDKAKKENAEGNETRLTDAAVSDLMKQGYSEDEIRGAQDRIDDAVAKAKTEYKEYANQMAKGIKESITSSEFYSEFGNMSFTDANKTVIDTSVSPQRVNAFNAKLDELTELIHSGRTELMESLSEDNTNATKQLLESCIITVANEFDKTMTENLNRQGNKTIVKTVIDPILNKTMQKCMDDYMAAVDQNPSQYIFGLQDLTARDRGIQEAVMDAKGANASNLNIKHTLAHQEASGIGKLASGTGGIITAGLATAGGLASAITGGIGIAQFSQLEKEIKDCQDAVKDL
ncbi:MAG: hypothetical protein LBL52_00345 [Rickettsiales bacterium]|nr:hypothetical protein [Rickettsiales bacterium]